MHFKHPELLFALFLLIIPLLVHLFQLRRFKTEKFTNVRFLKKAVLQTRKSSRLKKWLVLLMRMSLLACLVLAFAQPYFEAEAGSVKSVKNVIYLDNSYSLQAKGKNGILLKRSIQELLESLPTEGEVSFLTNEEHWENIEVEILREKLQDLDYSAVQSDWQEVKLRAEQLLPEGKHIQKNFIAISDFQQKKRQEITALENAENYLVQLQPENINNVSIDSAYISSKTLDETVIGVRLSATGNVPDEVPVALHDGENVLAKKTITLGENNSAGTTFRLQAGPVTNGRISIQDNGLSFDNNLFFSINKTQAVRVVAIGEQNSDFLRRIFKAPEFALHVLPENNIDYNVLSRANLIILNEVEGIPSALAATLEQLKEEGALLTVIPSANADLNTLNPFLRQVGLPVLRENSSQERLITDIAFSHPLYQPVFDEQVSNFQYPKVSSYFKSAGPRVLAFENNEVFLIEQNDSFLFTAALNEENSNFKNSPLIVPTFYNMGNLAISPSALYYTIGQIDEIVLQAELGKDKILKLSSPELTFIPQQKSSQNKVALSLDNAPLREGHFQVLKDSSNLQTLSFNLDRSENHLVYHDFEAAKNSNILNNIPDVFESIAAKNEVDSLWKCFVILALLFLVAEMLILKLIK